MSRSSLSKSPRTRGRVNHSGLTEPGLSPLLPGTYLPGGAPGDFGGCLRPSPRAVGDGAFGPSQVQTLLSWLGPKRRPETPAHVHPSGYGTHSARQSLGPPLAPWRHSLSLSSPAPSAPSPLLPRAVSRYAPPPASDQMAPVATPLCLSKPEPGSSAYRANWRHREPRWATWLSRPLRWLSSSCTLFGVSLSC